jgi:hypothetical protein
MAPGVYSVSITGEGFANDATSTCTFNPFSVTYEVPAPPNPAEQFTQSALDVAAELTKSVGPQWANMFATFWTNLQKLFNFGNSIADIGNYNKEIVAIADNQYNTDPEWRFNLDTLSEELFVGKPYSALNPGDKLNVARSVADELHATGWLIEKARRAGKNGAQLTFQ